MVETYVKIAVVGLVILLVFLVRFASRYRRNQLAAHARAKGYQFLDVVDEGMHEHYPQFKVFQVRRDRRFGHDFMTFREDGLQFIMLDFNYLNLNPRNRHPGSASVILVETGWPLGDLAIRPKSVLGWIAQSFTGEGLVFESPEFNERFIVHAPDPGWATGFIHPELMEYLTWSQYRCVIELHEGTIAVYTGARFEPHEFERYLKHLKKVLTLIPEDLRRRAGEPPSPEAPGSLPTGS